jgi:hypothetical protein
MDVKGGWCDGGAFGRVVMKMGRDGGNVGYTRREEWVSP